MQKNYIFSLMACMVMALLIQPQVKGENSRVQLREQFQAGQSFSLKEKMALELQIAAEGNNLKLKFATGLGYRYTVEQVAKDGSKTVGLAIYSLYSDLPGSMGVNNSFDSTDPFALPQPGNLFDTCLVGQEFKVEIKPDDTVGNVKFSDAFVDWVLKSSKNKKEPVTRAQLEQQVLQALNGQLAKSDTSLERGLYPEKPVATGDSWQKEVKLDNAGFCLSFQTTYTLQKRLNGFSVIEVNAKIIGVGTDSGNNNYEFLNLNGWLKGTFTVYEVDGWIHDFDLKLAIDGEVQSKSNIAPAGEVSEASDGDMVKAINSNETDDAESIRADAETEAEAAGDEKVKTGKFHVTATFSREPLE